MPSAKSPKWNGASAQSWRDTGSHHKTNQRLQLEPHFKPPGEACPPLAVWESHLNILSRYPGYVDIEDSPAIPRDKPRTAVHSDTGGSAEWQVRSVQILALPCTGAASLHMCVSGWEQQCPGEGELHSLFPSAGGTWHWISHPAP